jgi:CspA family cold shock protein
MCDTCTQRVKYGGKLHGRIKWFSREKGYGFIVEDSGKEIFVHRNGIPLTDEGILPNLDEGQEVLYESMDTPKGPQAVQVTPFP